ncbi:methyltransferase domain-containing protein [Paenibacillus gorillae]|uniref:methyltransferase domain-containing protein n=1 Tax=Paenibacillus gorillae TaxID=1243662 RepID=UPI0004B2A0CB|nr:methyltransferase domain-containing protein [Paenibacillus gorillae]
MENVPLPRGLTLAEEVLLTQLDPSGHYLNIAVSSEQVAAALLERGYRVQNQQLSSDYIGGIAPLSKPNETFDFILLMAGLSSVQQPKLLLDELHSMLKPDGFLAISNQIGADYKYTEETFLQEVGESRFTLYNFINDKQYDGDGQIGLSLWKKAITP